MTDSVTELAYDPASHYDRVTDAWRLLLGDNLHYGVFDAPSEPLAVATQRLTDYMAKRAKFSEGDRVLDVGCGNGCPALHLVATYGVRVHGITTSPVGVTRAAARAAAAGLSDRAVFELRDGTNNGYGEAEFDVVWVLEASHLMPDRRALIDECARVLRPAGRLVLCDIVRRRDIPFEEVRNRRDEFITLRDAHGNARMDPLERYAELVSRAGLMVEETIDLTAATLPTFKHWRSNARRNEAAVRGALGDHGFDAFVRSADILESLWQDGTLGYGMIAASRPSSSR